MNTDVRAAERGRWRSRWEWLPLCHFLALLIASTVLRAVLFTRFHPEPLPSPEGVARVFGAGLVRDIFVSLLLTCPMLLWFALLSRRGWTSRWRRGLLGLCLSGFWMVQIFLIFAEYFFFEEFRSRFNTVAIDYLLYP